jgi:hypothetical protein
LLAAGLSLSAILVCIASSIQMAAALESQERLAAEQARITQTLADATADYDGAEAGSAAVSISLCTQ